MFRIRHCLLSLFLVLSAAMAFAAVEPAWQPSVDREGIKVWKRKIPESSVMAFRAETQMTTTLSGLMNLFYDLDGAPQWLDYTKHVTALQRDDAAREYVLLMETVLPWPLSNRDAVIMGWWQQDPQTGTINLRGKSAPRGRYPENPAYIRYYNMRSDFVFTPLGNGKVKVVMEGHADPGGNIPDWAINMLIQESPFRTLRNMRKVVTQEKYQKVHFDGVREPVAAP